MENKKQILITAIALFSIFILLAQNNVEKIYAITHTDITLSAGTYYTDVGGSFFYLLNDKSSGTTDTISKINPITGAIIWTTTIDTRVNTGVYHWSFNVNGMSCVSSYCWVSLISSNATMPNQVHRYNANTGAFMAYNNLTNTLDIDGQSMFATGNQVFYARVTSGSTRAIFLMQDTYLSTSNVEIAGYSSIGSTAIKDLYYDSGAQRVAIIRDDGNFQLWNTNTGTSVCTLSGVGSWVNGGGIAFNSATNQWLVSNDSSNVILRISSACAHLGNISGFGEANYTLDVFLDSGRGEIITITSSASSTKLVGIDSTSFAKKWEYSIGSTALRDYMTYMNSLDTVLIAKGDSTARLVRLDESLNTGDESTTDDGESDTGNSVDGRCGTGTALDCVGDRDLINRITGAPSIANVTNDLLVSIGIIDGDNTDIKTNGTGLFLMLALGLFSSSVIISTIAVANNRFGATISYTEIPKEFWLFLVIAVVSIAFYLGWIPDIVFYGLVVGLAGLFSFGIYRHVKSS